MKLPNGLYRTIRTELGLLEGKSELARKSFQTADLETNYLLVKMSEVRVSRSLILPRPIYSRNIINTEDS